MRKALLLLGPLAVFVFLLFPPVAKSAGLIPCGGGGAEPACNFCHIFEVLTNVINFFLIPTAQNGGIPVVPLIAVPFIIFGGFFLLVGGANPQWVSRGKRAITAVVIGLILVYSAWLFINTFFVFIGVSTFGGIDTWYDVDCSITAVPPPPPTVKMVFVTSGTMRGDFGGLSAGNIECAARAGAAGLGGVWKAWLSTDTINARSGITDNEYRTVPSAGSQLVFANWADLTNPSRGPVNEIRRNEFGAVVPLLSKVWTGTMPNGVRRSSATCSDWTSIGGSAAVGDAISDDSQFWTDTSIDRPCAAFARLYCFEQ